MPIQQPATCDACNARDLDEPRPAKYAVAQIAKNKYNEEEKPQPATLLCEQCFKAAGGEEAFNEDQWEPFNRTLPPGPR